MLADFLTGVWPPAPLMNCKCCVKGFGLFSVWWFVLRCKKSKAEKSGFSTVLKNPFPYCSLILLLLFEPRALGL